MAPDDTISASLPEVVIYTDGACNPNPGPGGWAAVILPAGRPPQALVGSENHTTNNRMELRAAIEALAALQGPHRVHLYTDSEYLRRGITEWLPSWERHNWKTSRRAPVKNQDLWRRLAQLMHQHQVHWHWVRGHTEDRWNQYVDRLARAMLCGKQDDLGIA
ncbi:MAG: ribonuclease HI [Anaerolineae bacterium]|nr:ribonuclease HI [Anaerolineae bacterium]MDW8071118.1 ribonuclease HI [Anaerolineae bacterium]